MLRRLILAALMAVIFTFEAHAYDNEMYFGGARVPTFEAFPAIACHTNALAEPQFIPGTEVWRHRKVILEGAKRNGINFDCAFTIITWDCRPALKCHDGIMIDRTDGALYFLPDLLSGDNEFYPESSLLVVNAHIDEQYPIGEVPENAWRIFYEFSHGEFIEQHRDKGEKNIDILDTPHFIRPEILEDMDTEDILKMYKQKK